MLSILDEIGSDEHKKVLFILFILLFLSGWQRIHPPGIITISQKSLLHDDDDDCCASACVRASERRERKKGRRRRDIYVHTSTSCLPAEGYFLGFPLDERRKKTKIIFLPEMHLIRVVYVRTQRTGFPEGSSQIMKKYIIIS